MRDGVSLRSARLTAQPVSGLPDIARLQRRLGHRGTRAGWLSTMCIAAFTFGNSTDYSLVFAANRDELHARPTAGADWWAEPTSILGGRDLVAGGSWLAVDRRGRLAAVTNIPTDDSSVRPRSRGMLVRNFLTTDASAADFIAEVATQAGHYGPFNLLAYDGREMHYVGAGHAPQRLEPGIHALSNAVFGADWPKIGQAQSGLRDRLERDDLENALFELLTERAERSEPDASREQRRADIFIKDPRHGTRCSTVVVIGANGHVRFAERSFTAAGEPDGERRHEFTIER